MAASSSPPPPRTAAKEAFGVELVDDMYRRWQDDPQAVPESWQEFFEGFELASCNRRCVAAESAHRQSAVNDLIDTYRKQGHLIAQTDPLGQGPTHHPDLDLRRFGLSEQDLEQVFDTGTLAGPERATLDELLGILLHTYCRAVGVEYMHIQQPQVRAWLQAKMEPVRNAPKLGRELKRKVLAQLVDAHLFETFIHTHYVGQKRFSLEGAETLIPALHRVMERCPDWGVQEMVLGMTHRGRLNVLANILDKSYGMIFSEFESNYLPNSVWGDGDVKYHKGYRSTHVTAEGRSVHISLTANPSHLEAVCPVVEGRARAKQRQRDDTVERRSVLPLIIHGDAGFAGQGIVAETLNLSQLEGYRTGGTLHLIVNNQIGFTTSTQEARSSVYATDVAKMIEAPIFHVNGDDPEAVIYVMELALAFRQRFGRDVVVDLLCYRRHGHNEGDDPGFTQPLMYRQIAARKPILALYTEHLIRTGDLTQDEAKQQQTELRERLEAAYEAAQAGPPPPPEQRAESGLWRRYQQPYSDQPVETGVRRERLERIAEGLSTVPPGFSLNSKLARRAEATRRAVQQGEPVDWGFAEALAIGSLLVEGSPVRLSGQDSARGTFSHRHAVWYDQQTGAAYTPANHLHPQQARFCVYNSLLSEAAVLGFEYGYSLAEPRMLNLWEAQFGDFVNGAQVILDQFVVSSESKWHRSSGLVLLLPHGYEGQGPEHSNAYLERFLAAAAENNIQVCNLTTPAQYFHALRRQLKRPFRRPLIVMSPKSLLRHRAARSPVDDMTRGRFHEVLTDPRAPRAPRRVVFCSGKIYYELDAWRVEHDVEDVALVRLEQLYPFPWRWLSEIAEAHGDTDEVCWVQEEPQNRGGWSFAAPRLREIWDDRPVRYIGRLPSASPATGSLRRHREQQARIVEKTFEPARRGA